MQQLQLSEDLILPLENWKGEFEIYVEDNTDRNKGTLSRSSMFDLFLETNALWN